MNMFKKNGGFTLVELIVVIAILAILAGVAIPVYSGYIAKAEETADIAKLDAIKTAATAAVALEGVEIKTLDVTNTTVVANDGLTDAEGNSIEVDILSTEDFLTYYGANPYAPALNCTSANWNGTEWTIE